MMVKSSLQAVRNADIVLLLIDCHEAQLSNQELKLASFVFENGKAIILVRNKSDLLTPELQEQWEFAAGPYEFLLRKMESITISCKTGFNVGKLLPLIKKVSDHYNFHASATELTSLFKRGLEVSPLVRNTQKLKVHSAKLVAVKPPTIRLNVNEPQYFEKSQLSFFENLLRKGVLNTKTSLNNFFSESALSVSV